MIKISENKSYKSFKQQNMLIRSKSTSTVQRPSTAAVHKSNFNTNENENFTISTNRQTLNNIIPDLPSFPNKNNNSTALLYSKFIMKGINTNKVDLVKQSFNMKKDNLAYQKKNSLNYMKTLRSTAKSTKNEFFHQSIQNSNQEKKINKQFSHLNENSKVLNLQINQFVRIKSAKRQTQNNQTNHNLLNIQSQKILKRPKSAVSTSQTLVRNIRAKTAKQKKSSSLFNPFTQYQNDPKQFQTQRKVSAFINIQQQKGFFVNYIERNKRLLSASFNKNSVYLTCIDNNNKIIQNINEDPKQMLLKSLRKKLSPKKHRQQSTEYFNQDDQQIQRKRIPLTKKQIEQIKQKNKINIDFMKKNMPNQYKKYVLYLQMKQNNLSQKDRALLSINLDQNSQQFGQINRRYKNSEQTLEQAKQYYKDCENLCDQALHYVNLYKNRQKIPKIIDQILNIEACQQLLKLQQQRVLIKEKKQTKKDEIMRFTEIKQNIYQVVKKLNFFREKPQDICKKIFHLAFSIFTVQEDSIIIKNGDIVDFIYVILNGSVIKKKKKQQQNQDDTNKKLNIENLSFESTLFDGQSFGQPQNKTDKHYNYEIVSSQKVLLIKFPYFQYRKVYKESSNIQQRVELLSKIFGKVPGCQPLKNQNLQELALEMQSLSFQAKELIFRKGDRCQKLIIVASGKVQVTNQHILKRQKKNSKDVKKRCKSLTKLNIKDFSIQCLRSKNLKNYQILHQNQQQFVFYYQDIAKQLIRGNFINWQGFYHHRIHNLAHNDNFITEFSKINCQKIKIDPFTLNYSLISKVDNTKIYLLDMKRLQKLPQFLKHIIDVKVNLVLEGEKKNSILDKNNGNFASIKIWDKFKQKICNDIVGKKIKV